LDITKEAYNPERLVPTVKHAARCNDLGSNIYYSAGPLLTQNGQNTASDYMDILGSQVHPVFQVLFPNNAVIFKRDSPIHTIRSVQSWFEVHEDALQRLLWLAQSPNLNIIKTVWSVGQSRVRSRFSPSSLKQLGEEWYTVPLETIQILHESIPRRIQPVMCKWRPNTILIKKCVSFTAVCIIFVHPLYKLQSYIPWSD